MNNIIEYKNKFREYFTIQYKEYIDTDEDIIRNNIVCKLAYKLCHIYHINSYTFLYCDKDIIKIQLHNDNITYLVIFNLKLLARKSKLLNII